MSRMRSSDDLQLRDLRLILAIEQTRQLGLAALRLGLAQPAASRLLASIEERIGAPLFHRRPKGMEPTTIGEVVARHALDLLGGVERALDEVAAVRAGRAGSVRVGAVTGGAVALLVPAIRRLKSDASGAEIHVDVAPSDALMEGVLIGDYDFVLSRLPPGADTGRLIVRRARTEHVRFLVRDGHPLADKRDVQLGELAKFEWVVQAPHTPIRRMIDDAFISRGVPLPTDFVNTSSLLVMIAYALASDAVAPASGEVADIVRCVGDGLRQVDVRDEIVIEPYYIIKHKDRVASPMAVTLETIILQGVLP